MIDDPFRYGAGVPVPLDEMNVRTMKLDDPRREQVIAAQEAKLAKLTAASHSKPMRLSDACLKSLGLPPIPRKEATDAAE